MNQEHQQCTTLAQNLQNIVKQIIQQYNIGPIITAIEQAGGQSILVGGAVRDLLLGVPIKDVDIEVHGLPIDAVHALLAQFGTVDYVGRSFGVFKFFDASMYGTRDAVILPPSKV